MAVPLMIPEMPRLRLVSEEILSRADATRLLAVGGQLLDVR